MKRWDHPLKHESCTWEKLFGRRTCLLSWKMPRHSVFFVFQVLPSKSPKMNTHNKNIISKRKLVFPKHQFFRVHVLTFQVFWVCFASPTFWSASATISNRPRKGETLKYENRSFSGFRGFRRFWSVVVQRGELFPRRGIELYILGCPPSQ